MWKKQILSVLSVRSWDRDKPSVSRVSVKWRADKSVLSSARPPFTAAQRTAAGKPPRRPLLLAAGPDAITCDQIAHGTPFSAPRNDSGGHRAVAVTKRRTQQSAADNSISAVECSSRSSSSVTSRKRDTKGRPSSRSTPFEYWNRACSANFTVYRMMHPELRVNGAASVVFVELVLDKPDFNIWIAVVRCQSLKPLICALKPQSNGPSYSSNTVIGTLAVDW